MKNYYDLLGVEPTADAETIKKAFRREIARYHPDKVTHLGPEFQEMASTRAAELTTAYKILGDPQARAEYDESIETGEPMVSPIVPPRREEPSSPATESTPTPVTEAPSGGGRRFEQERAGKDDIVRRAVMARVRDSLASVVGECDMLTVRGFDLACLPRPKAVTSMTLSQFFKRSPTPAVLVRIVSRVDAAVATDAWLNAIKARMETKPGQPIVMLLIGNELAPAGELARAIEEQRKKSPGRQDTLIPVPVDMRDWSAKIPLNAPETVRTLIEKLKSFV